MEGVNVIWCSRIEATCVRSGGAVASNGRPKAADAVHSRSMVICRHISPSWPCNCHRHCRCECARSVPDCFLVGPCKTSVVVFELTEDRKADV
jgi:hypothetical protein